MRRSKNPDNLKEGTQQAPTVAFSKSPLQRATEYAPIAISLMALLLAVYEGVETRTHDRLSVRPDIAVIVYESDNDHFDGIALENHGLGPAILKKIKLYYRDKPISMENVISANERLFVQPHSIAMMSVDGDATIPPGSTFWLLQTESGNISDKKKFDRDINSRLTIAFDMCDFYDECVPHCAGSYCATLSAGGDSSPLHAGAD